MSIYIVPGQTEVEGRGIVSDVGMAIPDWMNAPGLIPVQFQDGSYAVMFLEGYPLTWEGSVGRELNQAIRESTKMPEIGTLATGILHIFVWKVEKKGHIRYHYGMGKEDREDYIEWS